MSTGTPLQLENLSIIDSSVSPIETFNLVNIAEGTGGASVFGISADENNLTVGAGQTKLSARNLALDIRTLYSSGEATALKAIAVAQTPVHIVGLGIDAFLVIGEFGVNGSRKLISAYDQYDGVRSLPFKCTARGVAGYGANDVWENYFYYGKNFLSSIKWNNAVNSLIATGWTIASGFANSFASGAQTLVGGLTLGKFYRRVYFPFVGEQVTFSMDVDLIDSNITNTTIEMEFLDDTVSTISTSSTAFSTTGRKSITATVPSGTVLIELRIEYQGDESDTLVIADPAFKRGTDATYSLF